MLPGIARIRERFLALQDERHDTLEDRLTLIADDTIPAADCGAALNEARAILHKIAGTAGSLGLADLGDAALKAECRIQDFTEAEQSDKGPVIAEINRFLEVSIRYCNRDG